MIIGTTLVQVKVLDAPEFGKQIGTIGAGKTIYASSVSGHWLSLITRGYVCDYKGSTKAIDWSVDTPPDPPPAPADSWAIVRISTDPRERRFDPATQSMTDNNPPKAGARKGTPIQIKGWETYVKKINIPTSWAWLLKIGSMWINAGDLPLRAEQLCCSCNIVHIVNSNATHYQIETFPSDTDTSQLDPLEWNWYYKPWLFHKAHARGIGQQIILVASGKHVYFPLLNVRGVPIWIEKSLVELLPTTLLDQPITAFKFRGASIWGMVDGFEMPLRLIPTRDDVWQHPDWPLVTQGCIPPA